MIVKKNQELLYICVILPLVFTLAFAVLTLEIGDRLRNVISPFTVIPAIKVFLNFSLLLLLGLLWFFYHRRTGSEKKVVDLENIIEGINPNIVMVVDRSLNITMCSGSITRILGYELHEIVDMRIDRLFPNIKADPDSLDIFNKLGQGGFCTGEAIGKKKDGDFICLEIIAGSLKAMDETVVLLRDITKSKKDKEALHAMQQAVENMQIGVTITDKNGIILYCNPADAGMHGYQVEELIGKDVRMFALPEKCKPMSEQELKNLKRFRRESSNVRKDGSIFPVQLMSDIVMNNEGDVVGVITTCEDITERKNNELLIQHIAYYDALTGLPNRSLFTDLLKKEIARAKRREQSFAILFIDLDRFKVINDTLGHTMGDLLLHMVAHRLKNVVRESDTVSRLSGDEFIVLITDVVDSQNVSVIAEKIVTTVSEVYVLKGTEIFITASIGISIYPTNGDDIETLIVNADTAMYQAKEQGGNSHQFYDSSVNANTIRSLSMKNSLRKAVERNEFLLYYQPLVDLNSGRIIGAEALLRWHNQDQGFVSPKEIISLAEETGLIIPLGEWLFRTACAQNEIWRKLGFPTIRMSVNVSMKQFRQRTFAKILRKILSETGLDPNCLELELTESIIMHDSDFTISVLRELKSLGISFAVDDFGTGYSSLSYLKLLPIDKIKIDRSFVGGISRNPDDNAIVKAIIIMAHSLNLKVIAEGVENNEQLGFLHSLKCDEAQGFLFSRPLSADDFIRMLLKDREKEMSDVTVWSDK